MNGLCRMSWEREVVNECLKLFRSQEFGLHWQYALDSAVKQVRKKYASSGLPDNLDRAMDCVIRHVRAEKCGGGS